MYQSVNFRQRYSCVMNFMFPMLSIMKILDKGTRWKCIIPDLYSKMHKTIGMITYQSRLVDAVDPQKYTTSHAARTYIDHFVVKSITTGTFTSDNHVLFILLFVIALHD